MVLRNGSKDSFLFCFYTLQLKHTANKNVFACLCAHLSLYLQTDHIRVNKSTKAIIQQIFHYYLTKI